MTHLNNEEGQNPSVNRPIISLQNVSKKVVSGERMIQILHHINLDIFPGELLVILGASGTGKTTLLNILGCMDRVSEGSFLVEGKDFSEPSDRMMTEYRRKYVGFIFQSYHLMPNLTALENVQLIAETCKGGLEPGDALQMVGLSSRAGQFPVTLSGGEQQRVAIARAIVKMPRLILADEPTAALDFHTGQEILHLIQRISRNHSTSVVMVTHNEEIAKLANRVIRLKDGTIAKTWRNPKPASAYDLSW